MPSKKKRPSGSRRPWWKRWWVGFLIVPLVLVAALGLLLFFLVFARVPLPDDIAASTSIVYDINGDEVSGLAAELSREDRDLDEIPEHVREAVMGAEDRGFYDHRGISARGIARALFTNVRSGDIEQGGSTITQQYVKNAEAGTEQTYTRKVREAALSIKLEQAYSKDEILEFYLNTAYWGRGAYGIEAAAQAYFAVPVDDLEVNEAATLAGMLAAPEALDPAEHPERADRRRRYTLEGMHEAGWLSVGERDVLLDDGLPEVTERQRLGQGPNAWYLDAVRWELSRVSELDDGELFRGLSVYTELDPRLQQLAQDAVTRAVEEHTTDGGAIVSVHPDSGGVRALVGGPDITRDENNVALRYARQVGSTFKAFTLQAYLEEGHHPETRFSAPATIEVEDAAEPIGNYGGSAYGEQSVYQATATSTNTVYIQMQEEAGREHVIDAARRAGLPTETSEAPYPTSNRDADWQVEPFAAMTLGFREFSPLEMASAFGTWAAEGLHVTPHLITRVEAPDGTVLWEPEIREERDVPLNVARTVTDVLRGVVESGTGRSAAIGRPSAGKTGTTDEGRDAWYVGYVPQLSTAVWMGNLDNEPIEGTATGGGLAAPVWGEYMRAAVEPWDVADFVAPDLDEFDGAPPQTASCPDGYSFREPPDGVDDDGWFPDVLVDITDGQGRPCVEDPPPTPQECPDGFAFANPPDDDADPRPEVLTDITDEDGRPCVEVAPEPDDDSDEDEPDVPEEHEPEPDPDDGEDEPDEPDEPDDGDDGDGDLDNPDDGGEDDGDDSGGQGDEDDGDVEGGSEDEDDGA